MSGEGEAAGDVLTGSIVAGTIEGTKGTAGRGAVHGACRNCRAALGGRYCTQCGQPAHIHRSLSSLGHEILHGVFHFEGKIWRTVPELFFHPGRLTRRYIDGERARFVSPMALFLFTVFLMFAVFSLTSSALLGDEVVDLGNGAPVARSWQNSNEVLIETAAETLEKLREERATPGLSAQRRAVIDRKIAEMELSHQIMQAVARGDWNKLAELKQQAEQADSQAAATAKRDWSWPPPGSALRQRAEEAVDNPTLLLYKLKTNGYKFSWALIPLSLPFLWLLFFWRRIPLYDHAVFATYSISFMMLLMIVVSLAAAAGIPSGVWATALVFVPPIHLYKHLRGTYGLSRFGAWTRLFLLLIAVSVILSLFLVLLLVLGLIS
jgi:Protein of unknown function (DUF3667)